MVEIEIDGNSDIRKYIRPWIKKAIRYLCDLGKLTANFIPDYLAGDFEGAWLICQDCHNPFYVKLSICNDDQVWCSFCGQEYLAFTDGMGNSKITERIDKSMCSYLKPCQYKWIEAK